MVFDLRSVSAKNIDKPKKACISFKGIIFIKKHISFLLLSNCKTMIKKKFLKFSFFEGTPRP